MSTVKQLLIIWTSTTGGTRQIVQAAEQGARSAASGVVHVRALHASQAQTANMLAANAYLFATPEHLASMAGLMKDFFDRCYYPCLDQLNGRPYALTVCAGSDGQGTIRQVERIATGWRLKRVAEPLLVITHAQTPEAILAEKHIGEADLQRCRELGATLALGLAEGVW